MRERRSGVPEQAVERELLYAPEPEDPTRPRQSRRLSTVEAQRRRGRGADQTWKTTAQAPEGGAPQPAEAVASEPAQGDAPATAGQDAGPAVDEEPAGEETV